MKQLELFPLKKESSKTVIKSVTKSFMRPGDVIRIPISHILKQGNKQK